MFSPSGAHTFSRVCSRQSRPVSSRRFTSSAFLKCLVRRHRTSQGGHHTELHTWAGPPHLVASNSLRALPRITSRHVSPRSLRHTNSREARSTCVAKTALRGTSRSWLTLPPRRRAQTHRSVQRQRVATGGQHAGRVVGPRLDLHTPTREGRHSAGRAAETEHASACTMAVRTCQCPFQELLHFAAVPVFVDCSALQRTPLPRSRPRPPRPVQARLPQALHDCS